MSACSCGNPEPHEVAGRRSFEDMTVLVWSDGRVTDRLSRYCPGGSVPEAFRADFIDLICTCTWSELSSLIRAAKKVCGRKTRPANLRAAVVTDAFPQALQDVHLTGMRSAMRTDIMNKRERKAELLNRKREFVVKLVTTRPRPLDDLSVFIGPGRLRDMHHHRGGPLCWCPRTVGLPEVHLHASDCT